MAKIVHVKGYDRNPPKRKEKKEFKNADKFDKKYLKQNPCHLSAFLPIDQEDKMFKNLFTGVLSLVLSLSLLLPSCSVVNKIQGNNIATVGSNDIYVSPGVFTAWDYAIFVNLKPTQSAVAGMIYDVDLYEKGKLRATTTVSFTQPDINIGATERIAFPATSDEDNAYFGENISNIFSVKVHAPITTTYKTESTTTKSVEINPNQPTGLTITSPIGGEIWHVGETVNITWTTTNLTKDAPIVIKLYPYGDTVHALTIDGVANTGSYKWIIEPINGVTVVSSHARIGLMANGGAVGVVITSISANDFTILSK